MKKVVAILSILLTVCVSQTVFALSNTYEIYDALTDEIIGQYGSYYEAEYFYNANLGNYGNLAIRYNDEIIACEYGVVELVDNYGGCQLDVYFDGEHVINSCLGVDAAFIKPSINGVYYLISGTEGFSNWDFVKVHPIDDYINKVSSYVNIDGVLYHNIKNDLESDYYSYSLAIDDAPDYIKENVKYFSYDGHYFYNDYHKMVIDYRNGERQSSVNPNNPYYNYYQYLPFRTESNYTFEEINDYINKYLYIDSSLDEYFDFNDDGANDYVNKSQFYDEIESFFITEEAYGVNSMMLLSTAMHESSFGKSMNSYTKNNFFKNAAYSSLFENSVKKYESLDNSVYAFAKHYVIDRNANPIKKTYKGSFLGNKETGMNFTYSNDPYWGEKVAAEYYFIDSRLGMKDKNAYKIAIVDNPTIYRTADLKSEIIQLSGDDYSFVVVEEFYPSYKVLFDRNSSTTYLYDHDDNYGYISKEDVRFIGAEEIVNKEYEKYSYDFNGGNIDGDKELILTTSKTPVIPSPKKDGYDFVKYVDNVAVYKKIDEIEMRSDFMAQEINSLPKITDAKFRVKYEDGSNKTVSVTSEHVVSCDTSGEEAAIKLRYCGVDFETSAVVNKWEKVLRNEAVNKINGLSDVGNLSDDDLDFIRKNIEGADLDFDQIRIIDNIFQSKGELYPVYYVAENDNDLSFSGLSLALTSDKEKRNYQLYDDTFYVNIDDVSNHSKNEFSKIASNYGFDVVGSVNLSFRYNLIGVDLKAPIITQVKIDDKQNDKYYSVYHRDKNGNIVKCKTTQTDAYIQFLTYESGDYVLLSLPSGNVYNIVDNKENASNENNGIDSFNIMVQVFAYVTMVIYIFTCIVMYYMLLSNREKRWKDYRKSLRLAVSVHEEKPKN